MTAQARTPRSSLHRGDAEAWLRLLANVGQGAGDAFVRLEVLGVADAARYLRLVRELLSWAAVNLSVTDPFAVASTPDIVAKFVLARARPPGARLGNRRQTPSGAVIPPLITDNTRGTWAARTAAHNLGLLPTALRFVGFDSPVELSGARLARARRALERAAPLEGTQSRPPLAVAEIRQTAHSLWVTGGFYNKEACSIICFSLYALLRASEALRLMVSPQLCATSQAMISCRMHDKTHGSDFRQAVWVPSALLGDSACFDWTRHRVDSLLAQARSCGAPRPLFSELGWRIARGALRARTGATMGALRPSAVLYHLELGTATTTMKVLAGWAEGSSVWLRHYFDGPAALRAAAAPRVRPGRSPRGAPAEGLRNQRDQHDQPQCARAKVAPSALTAPAHSSPAAPNHPLGTTLWPANAPMATAGAATALAGGDACI